MAKKKAKSRRSGFSFRKSSRKKSGSSEGNMMMLIVGSALYGAGREKVSDALTPLTSKIPLGNVADEVVLGTLGYFAAKGKFGNFPLLKSVGKAAVTIESARIGQAVMNGQVSLSGQGSSTDNSLSATIF